MAYQACGVYVSFVSKQRLGSMATQVPLDGYNSVITLFRQRLSAMANFLMDQKFNSFVA